MNVLPVSPTQVRIVEQLRAGPATMAELAAVLKAKHATVSSALWMLEFRGQVEPIRQEKKRGRFYRLTGRAPQRMENAPRVVRPSERPKVPPPLYRGLGGWGSRGWY